MRSVMFLLCVAGLLDQLRKPNSLAYLTTLGMIGTVLTLICCIFECSASQLLLSLFIPIELWIIITSCALFIFQIDLLVRDFEHKPMRLFMSFCTHVLPTLALMKESKGIELRLINRVLLVILNGCYAEWSRHNHRRSSTYTYPILEHVPIWLVEVVASVFLLCAQHLFFSQ